MSECTHDCSSCGQSCGERKPQSMLEKPHEKSRIKKVIGIVSGKGGVGKSLVSSVLAVNMRRKGYKTIENHQPIKHVDEMLKFMKIFAEDNRFLKLNVKKDEKGEVTMCTILDAVEQKGINKGKKIGYKNGQDEILKLVKILIASNRLKDIDRIYEDESYREQLIKQYKISN